MVGIQLEERQKRQGNKGNDRWMWSPRRPMGMEFIVQKKGLLRGSGSILMPLRREGSAGCMSDHVDNFVNEARQS